MDKSQALYKLWSEATGLPAYEENSIPDSAQLPYVSYQSQRDSLGYALFPHATVWSNKDSYGELDSVIEAVEAYIGTGKVIPIDNGSLFVCKGSPFAQRLTDDTGAKGYLINIQIEFFTEV